MTCKVIHGDSALVVPTIQEQVDLIVVDPPYGMAHVSAFAETEVGKSFARPIENDGDLDHAADVFLDAMIPLAAKTPDDCDMYVFCRWSMIAEWTHIVNTVPDFEVKNILIWDKETPGMGDLEGNWAFSYECILYAKKGRRLTSGGRRSSIIRCARTPSGKHFHPTQKPVQLLEELISMSSNKGDLVVDPFCGSASAIIAARNLGRRGIGIEKDDKYAKRGHDLVSQPILDLGIDI